MALFSVLNDQPVAFIQLKKPKLLVVWFISFQYVVKSE